jgi:uncharacterized LabA/DUF88 family protein
MPGKVKLPKLFRTAAPLLPHDVCANRRGGAWQAIQLRTQFQRRGERCIYISLVLRRRRVCRTLTLRALPRAAPAVECLQGLGIPAALIEEACRFHGSKIQCLDLQGAEVGRFDVVDPAEPEQHVEDHDGEAAAGTADASAVAPPWCSDPPTAPPAARTPTEAAVFWDYENISLGGQEDVHALSDSLRAICSGMDCRLLEKRMYFGNTPSCGKEVRGDLDQAGFTLVCCPKRSHKNREQVDKKILVDAMMFAWERAAKGQGACVVLVTNDGDYAYMLSRLRDMHVRTVVVYNGSDPASVLLKVRGGGRDGVGRHREQGGGGGWIGRRLRLERPPARAARQACDVALPLRGRVLPRPGSASLPEAGLPPRPHETPPVAAAGAMAEQPPHERPAPHTHVAGKRSRGCSPRLLSPRRRVEWPGV